MTKIDAFDPHEYETDTPDKKFCPHTTVFGPGPDGYFGKDVELNKYNRENGETDHIADDHKKVEPMTLDDVIDELKSRERTAIETYGDNATENPAYVMLGLFRHWFKINRPRIEASLESERIAELNLIIKTLEENLRRYEETPAKGELRFKREDIAGAKYYFPLRPNGTLGNNGYKKDRAERLADDFGYTAVFIDEEDESDDNNQ